MEIKIFVDNLDERLTMLDSSVAILEDRADMIDTSLILLGNELDHGGMYDYTIHTDTGTFENGYKQTIKLFKGDEEQLDSSTIEIEDRVVRRLTYIEGTNDIVATIFPKAIPDSNITEFDPLEKLIVYNEDKSEGNTTQIERRVLPTEYVQNVSLNLDNYDKHINIVMNTDSSLRDRMVFVEDHLWWENLGNDPTQKL